MMICSELLQILTVKQIVSKLTKSIQMIDVMSVPPTSTGEPRVRTTTDIRDNPNIIHPFPVPFLKVLYLFLLSLSLSSSSHKVPLPPHESKDTL